VVVVVVPIPARKSTNPVSVGKVIEVIESKKKERRRRRKISGERRKRTNFLLQFPFNQAQKPQYQHRYPLDSGCSRI